MCNLWKWVLRGGRGGVVGGRQAHRGHPGRVECAREGEGQFRGDLYQQLAVVLLDIPPLRDRGEDVLVLAGELLRQYAKAYRLSVAAEGWLRAYHWPGNVRELSQLLERVTLLGSETIIDPEALERLCLPRLEPSTRGEPARNVRKPEDEAARITQVLRQTGGNVEGEARLLRLSRKAVRYCMRKYGITRPPADRKPRGPSRPSHQVCLPPRWGRVRAGVMKRWRFPSHLYPPASGGRKSLKQP
jgi:transcriptional regulator with AAA-type ATPase domain